MRRRKLLIILSIIFFVVFAAVIKISYDKGNESIEKIIDKLPISNVNVPDESSKDDKNWNGIADTIDIVNESRKEAERKTVYKDAYYSGGYPPVGEGICTDVIWRGFNGIKISIKELIDKDIKYNIIQYPRVNSKPDPNIDFRRVVNQDVFFERNCTSLTTELNDGGVG